MFLLVLSLFGFHGIISNDTTWADTAHLSGDVWVTEGVTLTIDPGTVVLYADTCEWDTAWYAEGEEYPKNEEERIDLIVEGNLKALGTVEDSIYFHSEDSQDKGRGTMILANGLDSLSYCSIRADTAQYRFWPYPHIFLKDSEVSISSCLIEGGGGIEGQDSRVFLSQSEFDKTAGCGFSLNGGVLKADSLAFLDVIGLGETWDKHGVISVLEVDTCIVSNTYVDGATGIDRKLNGGEANGCFCVNSRYVRVENSIFKGIKGGYAYVAAGWIKGGNGCGLDFDSCSYVEVSNNQISGVGGGDADPDDVDGARGGDGYGVFIRDCSNLFLDNNLISVIYGGRGEYTPNGEMDGIPESIYCLNSTPTITNNEFNSKGTYIKINSTSQPVIGGAPDKGNRFLNYDGGEWYGYAIYNDSPNDIDATWNFWECAPALIDSLIFDYYDDETKGIVHYDNFTDVEEKDTEPLPELLSVNPIVTTDVLEVRFANPQSEEIGLSLFDAAGRRVHSQTVNTPMAEVDLSALPAGVYFVSMQTSKQRLHRKVIIH